MLQVQSDYIHLDTFCACFKYLFELVQVFKMQKNAPRNLIRGQFQENLHLSTFETSKETFGTTHVRATSKFCSLCKFLFARLSHAYDDASMFEGFGSAATVAKDSNHTLRK